MTLQRAAAITAFSPFWFVVIRTDLPCSVLILVSLDDFFVAFCQRCPFAVVLCTPQHRICRMPSAFETNCIFCKKLIGVTARRTVLVNANHPLISCFLKYLLDHVGGCIQVTFHFANWLHYNFKSQLDGDQVYFKIGKFLRYTQLMLVFH